MTAGEEQERAEPFVMREFEPHLDGAWIGQAVCYGPFRKGQAPGGAAPTRVELLEDLEIIAAHWNLLRIYGSDDLAETMLAVIREHDLPLRVMLGVWLENEQNSPEARSANIANAVRCVALTREYPEIVVAVNVGNETQVFWSWNKVKPESLVRYIRAVRNSIALPVTTSDDYGYWNQPESRSIAAELDFIATHVHPLWNGRKLATAIAWMDSTYREVKAVHPGKPLVISETGWATAYNPAKTGPGEQGTLIRGEAGLPGQERFLIELDEWITANQVMTFWFEVFDEPWKGGGADSSPLEVEQNWGVFYENRTPKESFRNYTRGITSDNR